MTLRFTVYGQLTGNNNFRVPAGSSMRKTKAARDDAKRVAEIALVAATTQAWSIPPAAAVSITGWNCRKDVDNIGKVILDSIKDVAYRDDADLMAQYVERRWDDGDERYDIEVTAVHDRRPGRKPKATVRAWSAGDPLPDGMALLGNRLVTIAEALALIGKR